MQGLTDAVAESEALKVCIYTRDPILASYTNKICKRQNETRKYGNIMWDPRVRRGRDGNATWTRTKTKTPDVTVECLKCTGEPEPVRRKESDSWMRQVDHKNHINGFTNYSTISVSQKPKPRIKVERVGLDIETDECKPDRLRKRAPAVVPSTLTTILKNIGSKYDVGPLLSMSNVDFGPKPSESVSLFSIVTSQRHQLYKKDLIDFDYDDYYKDPDLVLDQEEINEKLKLKQRLDTSFRARAEQLRRQAELEKLKKTLRCNASGDGHPILVPLPMHGKLGRLNRGTLDSMSMSPSQTVFGESAATQMHPCDFSDYHDRLQETVRHLVGSSTEKATMEVLEEEEVTLLRLYKERRNVLRQWAMEELYETSRLHENQTLSQEMERLRNEQRLINDKLEAEKMVYPLDERPVKLCGTLEDYQNAYQSGNLGNTYEAIKNQFIPWLNVEIEALVKSKEEIMFECIDELVKECESSSQ